MNIESILSVEVMSKSLNDLSIVTMMLRIVIAMICGGMIGVERGKANQPAGMRTYMLVSLGACIVMITGEYVFYKFDIGDPARLGAQVISGIGFLGAGSIVISGKSKIRGLTTAAGLWTSACIGLVIGIGFYECGVIATLAVYSIIGIFKKVEDRITFYDGWFSVYVCFEDVSNLPDFYDGINALGMKVGDVQTFEKHHELKGAIVSIHNRVRKNRADILGLIKNIKGVESAKYIS